MKLREFNTAVWTARNVTWLVRMVGGPRGVLLMLLAGPVLCLLGAAGLDVNKHIFDTHPVRWEEFEHQPWHVDYSPELQDAVDAWKVRNPR